MMKIFILIVVMLLSGCEAIMDNGYIEDEEKKVMIERSNQVTDAIAGIYGESESGNEGRFYYLGEGYVQFDQRFFIEGNECIFDEYMLARVVTINQGGYSLEIGSHCNRELGNSEEMQGGVVDVGYVMIPVIDQEQLEFYDQVKVYYEFPSEFEPSQYLDYMNYATEIEKVK